MSKMAAALIILAERDLTAADVLLPAQTQCAAGHVYVAAAKLLEAVVRSEYLLPDVALPEVPRGDVGGLRRCLPAEHPLNFSGWDDLIDPSWNPDRYEELIAEDGTLAPEPAGSRVRDARDMVSTLLPYIRDYVRS